MSRVAALYAVHNEFIAVGTAPVRTERKTTMFVTMIAAKIRAYLRYRETVRELSRLSDRELDDLGLTRSEIGFIARTHAAI
jgi:uncharacterized protein YjiS (DUF1127 family)